MHLALEQRVNHLNMSTTRHRLESELLRLGTAIQETEANILDANDEGTSRSSADELARLRKQLEEN
ncbi:MAG: hypothetical protein ABIU95_07585 [Burkholderiales bacterium]